MSTTLDCMMHLLVQTNHGILTLAYATTPCSKKVVHQPHINNLVNSQRIFKILSLAHSLENLR